MMAKILECTLRDGSYAVDFQFTANDTAVIASALENAGFETIELGHGLGLHASERGKGVAAATDEEYLRAAADSLKSARWGMFFIPGIGRHEDLEMAAEYGMHFVRIGTNAGSAVESKPYIEHAKKLGMFVSMNLMKSYVLPPAALASEGALAASYGADMVCVVDSAGCMFPDQVREYFHAMRDECAVPVGFHGHDNLALATANTLMAIEHGATMVDTTLQGMGRGGGNVPTEVLVSVLRKRGQDPGIDLHTLMDVSGKLIRPLMGRAGLDPINIVSGFAGFHSSYQGLVLKYGHLYGVDPRDLIIAASEVDQVNVSEEVVEAAARRLAEAKKSEVRPPAARSVPVVSNSAPADWQSASLAENVARVARTLANTSRKGARTSVLNVVAGRAGTGNANVSRFVQERFDYVIGSVEVQDTAQLETVIRAADGVVDLFLVDCDPKGAFAESPVIVAHNIGRKSRILAYHDDDVWVRSVRFQMAAVQGPAHDRKVVLHGTDPLVVKLALLLAQEGASLCLTGAPRSELEAAAVAIRLIAQPVRELTIEERPEPATRDATALVAFDRNGSVAVAAIAGLAPGAVVYDAGIGALSSDAIAAALARGIRVLRPDMRDVLAAEISALLSTERTAAEMGRGEIAGVPYVAGGVVGNYGDVVLDSATSPTHVVGIADGRGSVIYRNLDEFSERVQLIGREILRRQADAGPGH